MALRPLSVQKSASSVPNPARPNSCSNHSRRRGRRGRHQRQVGQSHPQSLGSHPGQGREKRAADGIPSHSQKQDGPSPDIDTELSQGLSRLGYAPTSDTAAFARKALDLHAPNRGHSPNSEHVDKVLGCILPKTYTGQSPDSRRKSSCALIDPQTCWCRTSLTLPTTSTTPVSQPN